MYVEALVPEQRFLIVEICSVNLINLVPSITSQKRTNVFLAQWTQLVVQFFLAVGGLHPLSHRCYERWIYCFKDVSYNVSDYEEILF